MRISRLENQVFKFIDINRWPSNELDKDLNCYRLNYIY